MKSNTTNAEASAASVTRYIVTKHFIGGLLEGITIQDESPVPFYVGFKSSGVFGSPFEVLKIEKK
jgi:hypothetical protein